MKEFLLILASFFLGSLPFGLIVCKRLKGIDIRQVGSGNVGATNAWRVAGPFAGSLVLILDFSKGFIPVVIAKSLALSPLWVVIVGLFAIIGHTFSPFLRFKGGRGVSTGLGIVVGISPFSALLLLCLWLLILLVFRYVSLASITSAFAFPVIMGLQEQPLPYFVLSILICILVIARHRANLERLFEGREPKIWTGGSK